MDEQTQYCSTGPLLLIKEGNWYPKHTVEQGLHELRVLEHPITQKMLNNFLSSNKACIFIYILTTS